MHDAPALPPLAASCQRRVRITPARLAAALLAAVPAVAAAQPCAQSAVAADGRMLGHFPYGEIPAEELVEAPPGFALRLRCLVRPEMLPDLQRLLDAASADPAVRGTLRGLSCHRSMARQTGVFCREPADAAERAVSVAPAGYSEHTSGFALDFAVRPSPNCPDAEACMAVLPAARWLRDNAPRFGFELSFPPGNAQGVKWEPWHWRWVGTSADAPGAARARFVFAAARARFAADPGIVDPPAVVATIAPPPPPPPPPAKPPRRRRR